jgi:1-acyl-sn-glycerol-3-phosphate acyltransferase
LVSSNAAKNSYTGKDWVLSSLGILDALEMAGVRVHVEGVDNFIKLESPCVFICNHMSTLETFILPCLIQPHREVTFVVKESLINYPLFWRVMRACDPVVVKRQNPREDLAVVLGEGAARLANDRSIIVFPQSTRSPELDIKLFNSIGVKLARNAKVPIVPVALKSDAWGCGRIVKDFGPIYPHIPVHFKFGEPITFTDTGKNAHQQVVEFISTNLDTWSKELPSGESAQRLKLEK